MRRLLGNLLFASGALLSMGMMTGCGSVGFDVVRYPEFWPDDAAYDSIAVAPVTNQMQPGRFVQELNDGVVREIAKNGTYAVADYTSNRQGDAAILNRVRETKEVDLVLFSTIMGYSVSVDEEERYETVEEPVYAVDADGFQLFDDDGNPVIDHIDYVEVAYPWFTTDSEATINVSVHRADGMQIYSKNASASCHDEGEHPFALQSPKEMESCAVWEAMNNAVSLVQPVWRHITMDGDRLLGIYRWDNNKVEETTKFSSIEDTFIVSIYLPSEARLNAFSFDIVARDDEYATALVTESFVWNSEDEVVYQYSIKNLYEASGGKKEFAVRFWSNNNIVMTKDIELKF